MSPTSIERFMTKAPHSIGQEQPLAAAHQLMNQYGIRHLPVLHGGKLVGMLTQRDLHLIETLKDVNPTEVSVSEAMNSETFTVHLNTSLRDVAAQMAENKYGSAVVMEKDKVVGVFTTVDAFKALVTLLNERKG